MRDDDKKLSVNVSKEAWKGLSILAIKHDSTLQDITREMIEKAVAKKGKEIDEA
jgi:macrodomain Ter protein organizer (MatP/YcbG family)